MARSHDKFVILHHLDDGHVEIVGFRVHTDRHETSVLSGILNRHSHTGDYTMYELHACVGPATADVDEAIAKLSKARK